MAILDKITTVAGKAVDKGNDVIEIKDFISRKGYCITQV